MKKIGNTRKNRALLLLLAVCLLLSACCRGNTAGGYEAEINQNRFHESGDHGV